MNNSALFLIQSPLHVLNAIEAIRSFSIKKSTFLVVISKHNEKWETMIRLSIPSCSRVLYSLRLDADIEASTQSYAQHIPWLKHQFFDSVFFSDSRLYIFVDLVNALQNPNTFLMDDGAGIIPSVQHIKDKGRYFDISKSSSATRQQQIEKVKEKYGLLNEKLVKYNLFTAFDFESCDQFRVFQNPMTQILHNHQGVNQNQVVFLGQPMVNDGYLSKQAYIEEMSAISHSYSGMEILYLAHPREEKANVAEIQRCCKVSLVETDMTVEKYLLSIARPPAIVSSFYSAALWYVAKFQNGIQVNAHKLDFERLYADNKSSMSRSSYLSMPSIIDLVYQHYKLRMTVIEPLGH
ncbi:polysialyltransferase family glycosyltransferase [uncultured Paraglaciecola sp.]|uniref:polysialyltransferase family glycosyltransferase n=1 Tax=uncultured Paraglaciecola sp. TaxID=1765024 RepID=UPI0026019D87|nr:polysialyltransferase family glycosyltransferase [uncultured Paraglaciecola sp.]